VRRGLLSLPSTPPRLVDLFGPRYSPPLAPRYSAPGTDEIYNFRCKRNNAIYIYTIYRGSAYTHTHGLSVHFREKYSICRVGRPCTLYICVSLKCVPLTSKIVYFVRPAPGKASREISTREKNSADLTCIVTLAYIVYFVAYRWSAYPAYVNCVVPLKYTIFVVIGTTQFTYAG